MINSLVFPLTLQGSLLWKGNAITQLRLKAAVIRLDSSNHLGRLTSLSLTTTRPSADKLVMTVDAWHSLQGLTTLRAPTCIRINSETLPLLLGLTLLEELSVLGLDKLPRRRHLSEQGAAMLVPQGLPRLRFLAYDECCYPEALIDFLSWTGPGFQNFGEPPNANCGHHTKTTAVAIEHLSFRLNRNGPELESFRRLIDAGSTPLLISRVSGLDLEMASDAGLENFGHAPAVDDILPSFLSSLAGTLQVLSMKGFHISTSYASRLAEALPGLCRVMMDECWLMPGSLNGLHSLRGLSHVELTSCLGSGMRPTFLLSFAANSLKPLHLHVAVGLYAGGEEEYVSDEMNEVAELLRSLRPEAYFCWDWFEN